VLQEQGGRKARPLDCGRSLVTQSLLADRLPQVLVPCGLDGAPFTNRKLSAAKPIAWTPRRANLRTVPPDSNHRPARRSDTVSIRPGLVRRDSRRRQSRPAQAAPTKEIPMRYLSITRGSEESNPNQEGAGAVHPPAALMEAMEQLIEKYMKKGVLIDTGGLAPSQQGFRMRLARAAHHHGRPVQREQGGHRRVGDLRGGLEGRGPAAHDGVLGPPPQALARVQGRVRDRGQADRVPGEAVESTTFDTNRYPGAERCESW
jgi:hypothetical protein